MRTVLEIQLTAVAAAGFYTIAYDRWGMGNPARASNSACQPSQMI